MGGIFTKWVTDVIYEKLGVKKYKIYTSFTPKNV
jgi:D-alanyl-lipoteichoic acid acyltransferase DltB (MBOAT superfamily)